MRSFFAVVVALSACGVQAKGEGNQRWESIAADVTHIMRSISAAQHNINLREVARPRADWCSADEVRVVTCGSAQPKRDIYWLAVFCKDQPTYIAEYTPIERNSLTLMAPGSKKVCRKVR